MVFRIWELPEITLDAFGIAGAGRHSEDVGRVLSSTRVSPLSVAKLYNILLKMSSPFVKIFRF